MPGYTIEATQDAERWHPYMQSAAGLFRGVSTVHKFGRAVVGTTFTPIAFGGFYRTPQPSAATALRVKAGNANDAPAGTGARLITIEGIDASGAEVSENIATGGASAGPDSVTQFIRVFRAYVKESGSYATQTQGSHAANVVIENAAGTEDWVTLDSTGFPRGQSEIGVYTVPNGKIAFVRLVTINTEATKDTDVVFFQRQGILKEAPPYDGMRIILGLGGVAGQSSLEPRVPLGPFPAGTDLGFLGKVATSTGTVDVDFEITLIDERP